MKDSDCELLNEVLHKRIESSKQVRTSKQEQARATKRETVRVAARTVRATAAVVAPGAVRGASGGWPPAPQWATAAVVGPGAAAEPVGAWPWGGKDIYSPICKKSIRHISTLERKRDIVI